MGIMTTVKATIDKVAAITDDDKDTTPNRLFSWSIQLLILISLISLSIETLPDLGAGHREFLSVVEGVVIILFTLEYALRLWRKKINYIKSVYGIVDLAAILPFYISLFFGSFAFDARFLRVIRIIKLVRHNAALRRLASAFVEVKGELFFFIMITVAIFWLAAAGIYYCEHEVQPEKFKSIFHSMWWAVITLTTVGYGDVYPITWGGRLFTAVMLMIALGLVAVPTALLSAAFSDTPKEDQQKESSGEFTPDSSANNRGE